MEQLVNVPFRCYIQMGKRKIAVIFINVHILLRFGILYGKLFCNLRPPLNFDALFGRAVQSTGDTSSPSIYRIFIER